MSIMMNMSSYEIEHDPCEMEREDAAAEVRAKLATRLEVGAAITRRPRTEMPGGWDGMDVDSFLRRMHRFHS